MSTKVSTETLKLETATRVRLRIPRGDGQLLVYPERESWVDLISANRQALDNSRVCIHGEPLSQLRQVARREVWEAASRFTSDLLGQPASTSTVDLETQPLVMAGHQPELYHPGVWLKNFALAWAARRSEGVGVNLIVDNDLFPGVGVPVPTGPADAPRVEEVPLDAPHPRQPWEEVAVQDERTFERFGDRVTRILAGWGINPVLNAMWSAGRTSGFKGRLAERVVAVRLQLERSWGVYNQEIPVSLLASLRSFRLFVCHMLAHAARFRQLHNRLLAEYRRRHKLRSKTHPVPELTEQNGWVEVPFWVWRAGEQTRRHLLVASRDGTALLNDGRETLASFRLVPGQPAESAIEALEQLEREGVRIRPRALTTTLFCRLLVCDVFIHGIGGAKYDELTDDLIAEFFGLRPPAVIAVTGTLYLPGPEPHPVTDEDARRLRRLLRDLTYNPQRYIKLSGLSDPDRVEAERWILEKQRLIEEQEVLRSVGLSRRERRARSQTNHRRYQRFREVNRQLQRFVRARRQRVERELAEVEKKLAANAILLNREYCYCLFPEEKLRGFVGYFL